MTASHDPPKPPQQQLAYAAPLGFWQQRRVARGVIVFAVTLAILASILLLKDKIVPRFRTWNAQREALAQWERCLPYTAPSSQVVYEEDPTKKRILALDTDLYFALNYANDPPVARRWPAEQPAILNTAGVLASPTQTEATLFFHERTNPRLHERKLLILTLEYTRDGVRDSQNIWSFHAVSILPDFSGNLSFRSWRLEVLVPRELNDPHNKVRFFAGQPDPADETHFTVGYEVNDQPGVLDGWLDPLSQVVLKIRNGPATRPY